MSNAANSEDRLESILDQVRVLKAKYDERAEVTGENFNVFSILDRESDEVKTHSAIIAELLDPRGSHSQGTLFLKLFLEKLLKEQIPKLKCDKDNLSDEYLKEFEVGVEVSFVRKIKEGKTEGRRIDILIEKVDDCIVIENKIWAADQPKQLESYHEYAERKSSDPILIYLTPYGTEPGEYTLGCLSNAKVVCLSYDKDIIKWVDACIKEVIRIPQIRETLHQYQMLLKKLTGQPINRRDAMALKDILLDKDENYNLIPELERAIFEAKFDLKCKFWAELEKQLEDKLNVVKGNLRYEVYGKNLGITVYGKNLEVGREDELKACIGNGSTQRHPGLTFRLSEDENYEVVFRIACGPDYLYYGFVLCEKGKDLRVKIDDAKRREYLYIESSMRDDGWKDDSNEWLAYKNSKYQYPEVNPSGCKSVEEYEKHTEEVVEKLVGEICRVIEKISEQEQGAAT